MSSSLRQILSTGMVRYGALSDPREQELIEGMDRARADYIRRKSEIDNRPDSVAGGDDLLREARERYRKVRQDIESYRGLKTNSISRETGFYAAPAVPQTESAVSPGWQSGQTSVSDSSLRIYNASGRMGALVGAMSASRGSSVNTVV